MTRRELRESIFSLLYMHEFYDEDQLEEQLDIYFANDPEERYSEEDKTYIRSKLKAVLANMEESDGIIEECSEGWKLGRINKVDVCILRLAISEMLFDDDVPYRVAINEAVELAKTYGGNDSSSFINGILGKVVRLRGLDV